MRFCRDCYFCTLSRPIIMRRLFNPTCSEDTFLIQLLSSFFPNYVNNNKDIYIHLIHASEMAIKTIVESPTDSPLYSINVTTFGKYIMYDSLVDLLKLVIC